MIIIPNLYQVFNTNSTISCINSFLCNQFTAKKAKVGWLRYKAEVRQPSIVPLSSSVLPPPRSPLPTPRSCYQHDYHHCSSIDIVNRHNHTKVAVKSAEKLATPYTKGSCGPRVYVACVSALVSTPPRSNIQTSEVMEAVMCGVMVAGRDGGCNVRCDENDKGSHYSFQASLLS